MLLSVNANAIASSLGRMYCTLDDDEDADEEDDD